MAPFKSSIGRSIGKFLKGYQTDTIGQSLNPTPTEEFSATGGSVNEPGNGYKYHTFVSPGDFVVVSGQKSIEFLLVAGGGGGGRGRGGGGAGGLVYGVEYPISTGTHPVSLGLGGKGVTIAAPNPGQSGGNTVFTIDSTAITALGGGVSNGDPGSPGGSGSGGAAGSSSGSGDQPGQPTFGGLVSHFGNPGGTSNGSDGAGGGGAGAAGVDANAGPGGAGKQYPQFAGPLIGVPALNPLNGYYAGGGGGCGRDSPGSTINGGVGGGGNGTAAYPVTGGNGVQYSGGGGGAGGTTSGSGNSDGGNGGDGICVVRYQV